MFNIEANKYSITAQLTTGQIDSKSTSIALRS